MNLVQLAEHAKNLSNDQLQMMLQRPDGMVPPFILAAEAARRQDMERSAMSQPAQPTTVLDDLIQSRADKSGISQLPGQMATPPAPQATPPQAQQPQMREGGPVRRYMDGSIVNAGKTTTFMGVPYDPSKDAFGGMPGIWSGIESIYNYATTPWSESYGPDAKPDAKRDNGIPGLTSEENAQDIAGVQRRAGVNTAPYSAPSATTTQPTPPPPTPKPTDPEATAKQVKTAQTEVAMGAAPSTTSKPTTENSTDADALRQKLEEIYGPQEDDTILGISPVAYAAIAKAMLSRERGLSSGDRWANASMALAADQQQQAADAAESRREGALALLNYDMRKADQAREDQYRQQGWDREDKYREMGWDREDKRYDKQLAIEEARQNRADSAAARSAKLDGIKTQADTYKTLADREAKNMADIADKYQGNPLGIKAWTPQDIEAYNKAAANRDAYTSKYVYYQNYLSQANGFGDLVTEQTDATGRPVKTP